MLQREADPKASGGLLCDEMGLGKTITTIGLLKESKPTKTLILGPLAVIEQWTKAVLEEGFAVFNLVKQTWCLRGGSISKGRVYITNYDKLLSNISILTSDWSRIVCDEAHILRNRKGRRYIELRALERKHTWLLTGTPIVNNKKELGSLVSLFHSSVKPDHNPSMEEAKNWMSTYALCRTTLQLRDSLPGIFPKAPTIIDYRVPFISEKEETFYRGVQGRISKQIETLMEEEQPDMLMMLQLLLRLRQISVHPQIYINARRKHSSLYKEEDWDTDSTKTHAIKRILSEESGSHGYVLFCHFHEEIALLKNLLAREPSVASIHTYHGGLNAKERSSTLQALQDARVKTRLKLSTAIQTQYPSCPKLPDTLYGHIGSFLNLKRHNILLAQIQSAGTGLNLQHMDRVIFTTPWWTAALMDQAIARVLRMGQTQPVTVYHIGLEEDEEESLNIDNYINTKVEIKRLLCKELLDAADHTITDKIKQ